jgi:hypothetical protein
MWYIGLYVILSSFSFILYLCRNKEIIYITVFLRNIRWSLCELQDHEWAHDRSLS